MSDAIGCLYIVATPIGNLEDITLRALRILKDVDVIAAEDTRHTKKLLQHFGITTRCMAIHEHNERISIEKIQALLEQNKNIALVSDAGTPLISDPGFLTVNTLRNAGFSVIPVPGPTALITALSAAGLPADHFRFDGFLPVKQKSRQDYLKGLKKERATTIVYESPHRLIHALTDIQDILGRDKAIVLAKELTKVYETFFHGKVFDLLKTLAHDSANSVKGEWVILVEGWREEPSGQLRDLAGKTLEMQDIVTNLLEKHSVKDTVRIATDLSKLPKRNIYDYVLSVVNDT